MRKVRGKKAIISLKDSPRHVPPGAKTARLEARITAEQKAMIERAAAFEGRSVTDFVVHAVSQAARMVIHDHEVWQLSQEQSRHFLRCLDDDRAPNKALLQAARQYRRSVDSQ